MRAVGRYLLSTEIAVGGMATVHLGKLSGPVGFARTVAIKRLHPQFAKDPDFASMFLDEARLAARIRHPNVVPTLDIVDTDDGELFLVMDYVEGESLSRVLRAAREKRIPVPLPIISAVISSVLRGLHAAHDVKDEAGEDLHLVHRDVSPQNVMIGADGVVRVVDFGVAKAMNRLHTTRDHKVKGKLRYMSPEQIRGTPLQRQVDIYAAGVVTYEMLTCDALFQGDDAHVMGAILFSDIPVPSSIENVPNDLDAIVMRALSREESKRFPTAAMMAQAVERAVRPALPTEVAEWLESLLGDDLKRRAAMVRALERESSPQLPNAEGGSGVGRAPAAATPAAGIAPPAAEWLLTSEIQMDGTATDAVINNPIQASTAPDPRRKRLLMGLGIGGAAFAVVLCAGLLLRACSSSDDPELLALAPQSGSNPAAEAEQLDALRPAAPAESLGAAAEPAPNPAPAPVAAPAASGHPKKPKAPADCKEVIEVKGKRIYDLKCIERHKKK